MQRQDPVSGRRMFIQIRSGSPKLMSMRTRLNLTADKVVSQVRAVIMLAGTLLLVACATVPQSPAWLVPSHTEETRVWPAMPEVPRYRFSGQLTGEDNFIAVKQQGGTMRRVFNWMVGLNGANREKRILQRPQSGAVDPEGRIYVTDISRQAVFVFDPLAGELKLWEWAAPETRFVAPIGIALGKAGEVWIADAELGQVVQLDKEGNSKALWGKGILKRPTGLAYDANHGELFVADTAAHNIKVFDTSGQLLRVIGRRGNAGGEFNAPTHLAFRNERLYVSDTLNARIQVLNANGSHIRDIGQRGLRMGDMVRPKGVAVDDEGNVYVMESYYDYMLIYDHQGRFLLPIGGTGNGIGEFFLPAGVWTDNHNRIFVADMFNGRIMIFQYLGERE